MSLLEKLKAGIKNSKEIIFHDASLRMRILSEAELQQCRIDAQAYAAKKGMDEETLYGEIAVRQLYISLTDIDNNKITDSLENFRSGITRVEKEYFIDEYLSLEKEGSPSLSAINQAEFDSILIELKKSPNLVLNRSNINLLRRLIRFLENQQ